MSGKADQIIGRFAPTPSGPLHFGSLVTAIGSYCEAKSRHGRWLIRIEDLDTPRIVEGSTNHILQTLEVFGFEWDGPVLYQSKRFDIYDEILQQLIDKDQVYACECSKKHLLRQHVSTGPLGLIYPGNCRDKKLPLSIGRLRLKTEALECITFEDRHYGTYSLDLKQQVGDIQLKRIDGIFAYHLAVVIDDAFQQINDIVRGADLIEVTCVHLYINQLFGYRNASYLHLPLVKNSTGQKLSKQTGAVSLDIKKASQQIHAALTFLGQSTPHELKNYSSTEILQYAVKNWDASLIPTVNQPII